STNLYRVARRLAGRGPQTDDSPGCQEQIRREGYCHRMTLTEIEAHVRQAHRLVAAAGPELAVLNVGFVRTEAVEAGRRAAGHRLPRFWGAVEGCDGRDAAEQAARARPLGRAARGPVETGVDAPRHIVLRCLAPEAGQSLSVTVDSFLAPGFHF